MNASPRGRAQQSVGQYVNTLWRRKVTIVLCVLVAVGGMLIVDTLKTPVYLATAKVIFIGTRGNITASEALTEEIELLAPPVRAAALRILGHRLGDCSAVQVAGTNVLDVNCRAGSEAAAKASVSATINGYNKVFTVNETNLIALDEGYALGKIAELKETAITTEGELNSLVHGHRNALWPPLEARLNRVLAEEQSFQALSSSLQLRLSENFKGVRVISGAAGSHSPISPKPETDGLLAALAGLALGVALALLRESLDDKIRSRADLEELAAGKPAIGMIPYISEWQDRKTPLLIAAEQPKSPPAEAFRALRTSLQFMSLEEPIKSLLITSPAAADGKTTVSADLAYTIAAAGQEVILVGCDLRKPRIHEFFGLSNDVGFTSILLGEVELDEGIFEVPGSPYLKIVPAGPIPPTPPSSCRAVAPSSSSRPSSAGATSSSSTARRCCRCRTRPCSRRRPTASSWSRLRASRPSATRRVPSRSFARSTRR